VSRIAALYAKLAGLPDPDHHSNMVFYDRLQARSKQAAVIGASFAYNAAMRDTMLRGNRSRKRCRKNPKNLRRSDFQCLTMAPPEPVVTLGYLEWRPTCVNRKDC